MERNEALESLKAVRENSPKRNFTQSFDLIVNLKGLDLKKTEQQVNLFVQLPHGKGRKVKVCALVAEELLEQAKKECDNAIFVEDFAKYQKKSEIRKIAKSYDFFIAQATIMPKIATAFGRVLGPKGKMPNPKSGCIVPPNANLKPLMEKLQKTINARTKNDPVIQCCIGSESMKDDQIADNAMFVYNTILHSLPQEKNNIRSVYIKLTMGKAIRIGKEVQEEIQTKTKRAVKKVAKEAKQEQKAQAKAPKEKKADSDKE